MTARVDESSDPLKVYLAGVIDEAADLSSVFGRIQRDAVVDVSAVERITSPGIVLWVNALKTIPSEVKVSLEAISHALAAHGQSILGMFGNCRIESCMAPYFCPRCETNYDLRVTASEVRADGSAPDRKCEVCGSMLDFDELDAFLEFMVVANR